MSLKKQKRRRAITAVFSFVLGAVLVLISAIGIIRFNNNLQQQQLAAVKQSVSNAVIHCYSLEGAYPPNLEYLAKNYGLVIDNAHYIYDYSIFASNVPPQIKIFRKN